MILLCDVQMLDCFLHLVKISWIVLQITNDPGLCYQIGWVATKQNKKAIVLEVL